MRKNTAKSAPVNGNNLVQHGSYMNLSVQSDIIVDHLWWIGMNKYEHRRVVRCR
jgi:hypothetical protein